MKVFLDFLVHKLNIALDENGAVLSYGYPGLVRHGWIVTRAASSQQLSGADTKRGFFRHRERFAGGP